jgi:hypothetical protein
MHKRSTYKHAIPHMKFKYNYYTLGFKFRFYKRLKLQKIASKDSSEFVEAILSSLSKFSSP